MSEKKDDMYDEFGNYLGPLSESEEEESFEIQHDSDVEPEVDNNYNVDKNIEQEKVELHEEKNYYPSYNEVYPQADTLIQEEDIQDLNEPIIKPPIKQNIVIEHKFDDCNYSYKFLTDVKKNSLNNRSLAIVGGFHSGKTKFCDILINSEENFNITNKKKKYTDYFVIEQKRKLTHIMKNFNVLLEDKKGKSYGLNILDTPGHPDFFDEVKTAISMVDGVVIIIDVIEGITEHLKEIIKEIKFYEPDVMIVFNKIDRFIVELKIPPEDAYLKLNLLVQELQPYFRFKPMDARFFFASTRYNILYHLNDFSHVYSKTLGINDISVLTNVLWGDIYYDLEGNTFVKQNKSNKLKRTFIEFILIPIYKIFSHVLAQEKDELKQFLQNFNLDISNKLVVELEHKKLLQLVFSNVMMNTRTFVSHVFEAVRPPLYHDLRIMSKLQINKELEEDELLVIIPKQIPKIPELDDVPSESYYFGRVLNGSLRKGDTLFMNSDTNESQKFEVSIDNLYIAKLGKNMVETETATRGSLVCIENYSEQSPFGRGWLSYKDDIKIKYRSIAIGANVKLGIEPVLPSDLEQLHRGVSLLQNVFSGLRFRIEETGENIIIGRGELFLDTILLMLRNYFAKIEIRVAEPTCLVTETCMMTSHMFSTVFTTNKANSMSFLCEPMESEFISNFAYIKHSDSQTKKLFFKDTLEWDAMEVSSLWAFSPFDGHPSYLQDYTIPSEVRKDILEEVKPALINGYEWAVKQGPLCEEPIMNCGIKLSKASFHEDQIHRSVGQISPAVRRGIHSSLLLATPKLMEPYYSVDITCSQEALSTIYTLLAKRRGQLISETPNPGTPLYKIVAKLPVLDSFGFETDIRVQTLGQANVLLGFSSWELMPGDPLDKNIKIQTLEPAEPLSLARDVFIKTRRRKGLGEDISILKYFDDENLLENIKNSFYV